MSVIEASGIRGVVPGDSGAWGLGGGRARRWLGDRVDKIVAGSWLVLDPPPPFIGALQALQDPERWRQAREQLYSMWLTGAPTGVGEEVRREMGAYDFDMCSRAARAITADYARYGNPLHALAVLDPKPDVLHVFSQPRTPEFLAAQETFSAANPWFWVKRLDGVSQFPPLELSDEMAAENRTLHWGVSTYPRSARSKNWKVHSAQSNRHGNARSAARASRRRPPSRSSWAHAAVDLVRRADKHVKRVKLCQRQHTGLVRSSSARLRTCSADEFSDLDARRVSRRDRSWRRCASFPR